MLAPATLWQIVHMAQSIWQLCDNVFFFFFFFFSITKMNANIWTALFCELNYPEVNKLFDVLFTESTNSSSVSQARVHPIVILSLAMVMVFSLGVDVCVTLLTLKASQVPFIPGHSHQTAFSGVTLLLFTTSIIIMCYIFWSCNLYKRLYILCRPMSWGQKFMCHIL